MKNKSKLLLISSLIVIGLKPSLGQYELDYSIVAGDLAKIRANKTGEAFQYIDDSVSYKNRSMNGLLRIIKTENPNKLNFVPIGKWVYSGSFPTISGIGKVQSRDTTTYDSLGNIIRRVYYNGKKEDFKLTHRTTYEIKNGLFIEYTEYLKDDKVETSFYQRITDFDKPKAYDSKTKIPTGTLTIYKNGKIKVKQTYDTDGKLITDGKHER